MPTTHLVMDTLSLRPHIFPSIFRVPQSKADSLAKQGPQPNFHGRFISRFLRQLPVAPRALEPSFSRCVFLWSAEFALLVNVLLPLYCRLAKSEN